MHLGGVIRLPAGTGSSSGPFMSPRLSALLLWDLGQGAKKNKKSWEDVSPKHLHSEAEMGLLLGDSAHVSLLFYFYFQIVPAHGSFLNPVS